MNTILEKFLSSKINLFVMVPIALLLLLAGSFIYLTTDYQHENKVVSLRLNDIQKQLFQLSDANLNSHDFKVSLSHINEEMADIKNEEPRLAKSVEIGKVSEQLQVIQQDVKILKKLVVDSSNGKEFLNAKVLPFQVMSVDVIAEQPFVSINYDHHVTPLGIGDTLAGWQITDADYALSTVEFKNNKSQYVKINLQGQGQ